MRNLTSEWYQDAVEIATHRQAHERSPAVWCQVKLVARSAPDMANGVDRYTA